VAGWEGGRAWVDASSLLLRYNAIAKLVEQADLVAWLEKNKATEPALVVDHLAEAFLCVPLSAPKRSELVAYLGALPPAADWGAQRDAINARLRAVLVAVVSLPEYQVADAAPGLPPRSLELAAR